MKTFILFFLTLGALLAGAILIGGQHPGFALVFASVFTAGLAGWTGQLYEKKFLPLTREQPLRVPLRNARREPPAPPHRLAA